MAITIDAHQHFWEIGRFNTDWMNRPGLDVLRADHLPEDLLPHLQKARVDYSIFVQTQHDLEENRWVLKLAEQYPFIAGVVGWIDLASEACEDQLQEFRDHPKFVGVRHITQDEPDDDFTIRPEIIRGLTVLQKHGVPFDLLFYVKHLKHAATLAGQLPDLPLIIDHLAKPGVKERRIDDWLPHLRAAAAFPNMYCKLSGLITEADWKHWTAADLKPYVQHALELFGPERCMFGSDWPVCRLAGEYDRVIDALNSALGPISRSEREWIFGLTATNVYQLMF